MSEQHVLIASGSTNFGGWVRPGLNVPGYLTEVGSSRLQATPNIPCSRRPYSAPEGLPRGSLGPSVPGGRVAAHRGQQVSLEKNR